MMGIQLIIHKGPIRVPVELGVGFMSKKDFNKLLRVVKSLEGRVFDGINKVWEVPLTINNLAVLEKYLSRKEVERLNALLKNV